MLDRFLFVATSVLAVSVFCASVPSAQHATPHASRTDKTTVVFVCEHGAAQSVIAAAYFNRLAAERHLPYRAIARGASPQENPSVATAKGLEADGIAFPRENPKGLSEADVADAVRIVAFCPIAGKFSTMTEVDEHDDVPLVADGYAAARDKIVGYVKQVLSELERERQ